LTSTTSRLICFICAYPYVHSYVNDIEVLKKVKKNAKKKQKHCFKEKM